MGFASLMIVCCAHFKRDFVALSTLPVSATEGVVCQSYSGYLAWFARSVSPPSYLDPSCTKAVVAYNCTYFSDSVVGWPAKTDTTSNQIVIGSLHQAKPIYVSV